MSLSLRYHVRGNGNRLSRIWDLVLVEYVLGLVHQWVRLRFRIYRRLRIHSQCWQSFITDTSRALLSVKIQIQRLGLQTTLLLLLLRCVKTTAWVRRHAAEVELTCTMGDAKIFARCLIQIQVWIRVVERQLWLAYVHLLIIERAEATYGGNKRRMNREFGRNVVITCRVLAQVLLYLELSVHDLMLLILALNKNFAVILVI